MAALVMFVIELTSRRVFLAGCTEQAIAAGVTQEARKLTWELGQANLRPRLLIHDLDNLAPPSELGLRAPLRSEDSAQPIGEVVCRSRLGGLLHEYSRQAA